MPGFVPGEEAGATLYTHIANSRMKKPEAKTGIASGEEKHDPESHGMKAGRFSENEYDPHNAEAPRGSAKLERGMS